MTGTLGKDLLGLESLSGDQIRLILDTAEPFKEISERAIKKVPALRGSTIVNLFFENSTRTRISFEFAEKRLSADTVNVSASGSSVSKGETLVDTARNLEAMRIDMVVIRHSASGAAKFLADRIQSNVINAGDGTHEHPTQGLLDILTLRDRFVAWLHSPDNDRAPGRTCLRACEGLAAGLPWHEAPDGQGTGHRVLEAAYRSADEGKEVRL